MYFKRTVYPETIHKIMTLSSSEEYTSVGDLGPPSSSDFLLVSFKIQIGSFLSKRKRPFYGMLEGKYRLICPSASHNSDWKFKMVAVSVSLARAQITGELKIIDCDINYFRREGSNGDINSPITENHLPTLT